MMIAYETVFEKKETAHEPRLYAGRAGNIMISMRTSTFEVKYVDGRASVGMHRCLTGTEARELAEALLEAVKAEEDNCVSTVTNVVDRRSRFNSVSPGVGDRKDDVLTFECKF